MMSELRDLYQQMILDHSKRPRHFRELGDADCRAEGHNPLCGDKVTVFVRTDGDRIGEISFQGAGCAISVASASMMSEALAGKTLFEAERLFKHFHELVTGHGEPAELEGELEKLVVFSGVREFPVRVKCATLAWHTLLAALEHREDSVSTE